MTTTTNDAAADRELLITRLYDAPRQLVFDAWTKPEHLEQWQGAPKGMTVTVERSDIQPGGKFKLCMHGQDGTDHWLQGEYREVTPPERLVFTHAWLNAQGECGIPTVVTLTFTAQGDKTLLTLHQTGFSSVRDREGHREGWTSTFDRLEEYLATQVPAHQRA